MIAKSLLVNGPSRFLSTIYANDLNVGGGLTITGTINLAAGTSTSASLQINSKGALYGYDAWLRINEQKQFTSGVYFGTNIVRTDGSFQIGNAGANINLTTSAATFKVPINVNGTTYYWNTSGSINANAGTFVSLTSPKGVFTNMIVTDTLVATHQEIEHVANLGGVFLVTPTVKCISSGSGKTLTSLTVTAANTTRTDSNGESVTYNYTLAINDSAFSTATIGGNTWGQYGEVKVSGNINGVVLGTCKGFIQSINTTSHVLTVAIKYTGVQTPATPSDISTVVDLNVMLTTIYDSGNSRHNPVGIWMRSRDTNGYSHISLYGGTDVNPTVRIGNLANLPAINGVTPEGWGIYTDHGYFNGVIVSTSGKIGNFTISSALYSSTHSAWNTNVDGIYIGSDYISFGKQGVTYFKPDGTGKIGAWTVSATALSNGTYGSDSSVFISTANMASKAIAGRTGADWRVTVGSHLGVTNTGALYANSANITGAINASSGTIGSNSTNKINIGTDTTNASIYYGVESLSDTSHDGFYIGADGIVLGKGIFKVTDGGALTATSATITGAINADTGTIGGSNGWTIASQQISSGTIGNNQSMFLGTKNLGSSTTIGGREGSDWRFTVGSNFGVTNTGAIYASSATINSGTIASSVTIGDTTASTVVSNAANGASAYSRKTAFNSTCSTSASTRIKAVTCAGFTLTAGNTITIRFTTANTYKAGSVKLNINNLGAKDIYVSGAATSTTNLLLWSINANITFIYDGQGFRVVSEPRIWYGTCSTAANTAVKQATVYESVVCKGTKVALNMTNNNTSDSASLYITGQADNARSIYYGTTSNVPTTANEYGWKSSSTATFVFDGSVWRYDDASTMNQGYTAAKTASNFIVADSTGLMVADMSGGAATSSTVTVGNVLIDNNSVDIRDGTTVLASYGEITTLGRDGMSQFHISGDELYGTSPEGKIMFSVNPGFDQTSNLMHLENSGNIVVTNNTFNYTLNNTPTSTAVKVYGFLYFDEEETIVSKTPTWSLFNNETVTWEAAAGTISYDGSIGRSNKTFSITINNTNNTINHAVFYFSYTSADFPSVSSMTFGTRLHYGIGQGSATFGQNLTAYGAYSFAEGIHNYAIGVASHVEGGGFSEEIDGDTYIYDNYAYGDSSHAEGRATRTLTGTIASHAEGSYTTAGADYAHAEGTGATADGYASHAEGGFSSAHGRYSHTQNYFTIASSDYQTAIGQCNIADNNNVYALIIGNGASSTNRSNALAVTWDGTLHGAKVQHNTNSTFELNGFPLNGMVTTNTVYLELTTERFLDTVSTITVNYLTGGLRGVLGYLDGTTYNTNWKGSSSYTITAEKRGRRHIVIIIAKKSGNFTNITQNTPVCFYASTSGSNIGLKLTFS